MFLKEEFLECKTGLYSSKEKVFSHENRLVATNIKNILEINNISVMLKNEFAASAIGEISPFDTWVEVWVKNSLDLSKAKAIIEEAVSPKGKDWYCANCGEINGAAFQICWNCAKEPA